MKIRYIIWALIIIIGAYKAFAAGCVIPENDLALNDSEDVVLCGGIYSIEDTGSNGIIRGINVHNIILDLNGSTLKGTGSGSGIVTNGDNITIKNGYIDNYATNIYSNLFWNTTIVNVTFSNYTIGVRLEHYNVSDIINCTFYNRSDSVKLQGHTAGATSNSRYTQVIGNNFNILQSMNNYTYAINVDENVTDINISNNTISNIGLVTHSDSLTNTHNYIIQNNSGTCWHNQHTLCRGINFDAIQNFTILDNYFHDSNLPSTIAGSKDFVIENNNIYNITRGIPFKISNCSNGLLVENTITLADKNTQIKDGSYNITIRNNTFDKSVTGDYNDDYDTSLLIEYNNTNILVYNNTFSDCGTVCILIRQSNDTEIIDNTFDMMNLTDRENYIGSDYWEPRTAVFISQLYKTWLGDSLEVNGDNYTKVSTFTSFNVTINGSTFTGENFVAIRNQNGSINHDLDSSSYYNRTMRIMNSLVGWDEYYIPNSIATVQGFQTGDFFTTGTTNVFKQGYRGYNQMNFTLSSDTSNINNENDTVTYNITLYCDANEQVYSVTNGDEWAFSGCSDSCVFPTNNENIATTESWCNADYYLGDGINIVGSDDVTLNCNGATLRGSGTYGIEIDQDYINIANCTLEGYATGVYLSVDGWINVTNVTVENTTTNAVYINNGHNVTVNDCTLTNSTYGVHLLGGLNYWHYNLIENNTIQDMTNHGLIYDKQDSNSTISNNLFLNNPSHIKLTTSNNTVIKDNTFTNASEYYGINLVNNTNTTIHDNTFSVSDRHIYLFGNTHESDLTNRKIWIHNNTFDNTTTNFDLFCVQIDAHANNTGLYIEDNTFDNACISILARMTDDILIRGNTFNELTIQERIDNNLSSMYDLGCSMHLSPLYRSYVAWNFTTDGNLGEEDYRYHESFLYNFTARNITIEDNTFGADTSCYLVWTQGDDQLKHDFTSVWNFSYKVPNLNTTTIIVPNSVTELTNVRATAGSCTDWGSPVEDTVFQVNHWTSCDDENVTFNYTIAQNQKIFTEVNGTAHTVEITNPVVSTHNTIFNSTTGSPELSAFSGQYNTSLTASGRLIFLGYSSATVPRPTTLPTTITSIDYTWSDNVLTWVQTGTGDTAFDVSYLNSLGSIAITLNGASLSNFDADTYTFSNAGTWVLQRAYSSDQAKDDTISALDKFSIQISIIASIVMAGLIITLLYIFIYKEEETDISSILFTLLKVAILLIVIGIFIAYGIEIIGGL